MTIGRVIHFKVKISLSLFIITSREHYTTLYQVELGKSSYKNLLGADFVSIQKIAGIFFQILLTIYFVDLRRQSMKITQELLKQLIKEEIDALDKAKDPKKLTESAYAMTLLIRLNQALSTVQGGGPPPNISIQGERLINWLAKNSGYSANEIASEARKMPNIK